jgi:hypothetical protein
MAWRTFDRDRATALVDRLPGESWARTPAMKERFGISW